MPKHFTFTNPNFDDLAKHIIMNSKRGLPMVQAGLHESARGAVICAPGPELLSPSSLREIRACIRKGWHVIAIKEAIRLLRQKNLPVHYSVAMDPDASQIEKTPLDDEVIYCVASSCHPALFEHLQDQTVWIFHSITGWLGQVKDQDGEWLDINEFQLYKICYGVVDCVQGGFTVTNRALSLAKYMGFRECVVAGASFGWRPTGRYYAEGVQGKAGNLGADLCDNGAIDGRPWMTRPDMLASAVDLAMQAKRGHVRVIGDSIAASLAKRSEAFINELVQREETRITP